MFASGYTFFNSSQLEFCHCRLGHRSGPLITIMDSYIDRSLSPPTPFPTLDTTTTPVPATNLPRRTRSRSDTLPSTTERPQLGDLIPASRRDSINSNTSDSSLVNAALEHLRAEVIRPDRALAEAGVGLGIFGEETAAQSESEKFNYRGVQSARPCKFRSKQLRFDFWLIISQSPSSAISSPATSSC